ncbi:hypothetical protein ABEB36_004339 [Hypothenemus hampei]|uniref:Transient receptor potential channel pyrexia n=1 Tax=Hypothenemus hampei TaxID=57062 RepID=A0ABD1F6S9_HYPHA
MNESLNSKFPTFIQVSEDNNVETKQKSLTSFYRPFFTFISDIFKLCKCLPLKKAIPACDYGSVCTEQSENLQAIENKFFKRSSCINNIIVPLTNQSLKKSIFNEMRKYGNLELLKNLMEDNLISINQLNNKLSQISVKELSIMLLYNYTYGLTALHVAAYCGCTKSTKFLLSINGSSVNIINKYYSPLHCAALAKRVETSRILLDHGARLNSLTNGPGYETPLFLAVKENAIECVKLFMDKGALIFQEGKLADMSPLFLAAELGRTECLKMILDQNIVDCNKLRKSENGHYALHLAAEHGHSECIEILLDNGANPNLTNLRAESPMHLAIKAKSYASVLMLILKGQADLNLENYNRRTPLHEAVQLVADTRIDIVKALIENGANVNVQDQHGFTPLHIAALNELPQCVSILISHDADCSIKSNSGMTAFSIIVKKTPGALEAIKDKFTEHVTLVYHSEALTDMEMRFDFKNGLQRPKEYSILNAFIDAGHKEMLLHPFIMAFLFVTWGRIRRCYFGMIGSSLLFSLSLLMYVLTSLAYECHRKSHDSALSQLVSCHNRSYLNELLRKSPITLQAQWYILLSVTLSLIFRKIYGFHGYPSLRHYCINWGNVLEWNGIISVFIISFHYTGQVESWQVYFGAFAIICSWTNIMFLIGQLPIFGPYVEMFQKVQSEFQKLLLVFFPFLVGFTIGFCIIFPNSSTFYDPLIGLISALVMMTGDMNYNILLDYSKEENSSIFARFTSQIVYTFFLLFITIILMNLLVGIAVHDIQGLQKNADLSRLVRQAKMCSYIELSHYKRSHVSKSIMKFLRVVPKSYIPVLRVKPLDPLTTQLPKEVVQAAYDLAKARENKRKTIFNRTRSEGGPWKRLFSRSFRERTPKNNDKGLKQVLSKLENQADEIQRLFHELADLKATLTNK